jgi:hypothetical protein
MSVQTSNKTFGDGGRFRKDRPSYSELKAFALSHDVNGKIPADPTEYVCVWWVDKRK